jgi:hypothetical protein
MKDFNLYIPDNEVIEEQEIYLNYSDLIRLLKKYKNNPVAIQFIAEMME